MIDSGDRKVPALLRRIDGAPLFDFEVIAGVRRHFLVAWLNANGHPHFQFVGVVHALTDESAFFMADLESRTRKDLSGMERAGSYAMAVLNHYDGRRPC